MNVDVVLADSAWEGVEPGVEALVDAWLAQEGAMVEAGQPLVRTVLVKSTLEVEATVSGRLRILVPAGRTFRRGQPLATLETD